MSYNGSGTFVINTSGQPVVTGTVISSTAFNALTADLGTGLSTAITKDGQTITTAKIPFAQGMSAAVASNFAAGTVAAPAIYLSTDTGTGLYRIGANNDGFAISGTKLLDFGSALLGITGAATISTTLGVTGATTLGAAIVGPASAQVFNTVSTTVNAFGAATTLNMGNSGGTNTIAGITLMGPAGVASPGTVGNVNQISYGGTDGRWALGVANTAASGTARGLSIFYTAITPNDAGNQFFFCADPTAARIIGLSNGGISNYSANNTNLSDVREKKNIELAGSYLDKICAIPVKTFLFNDQTDSELNLGVIAQDVEAIAPELVTESNWGTEEAPKIRKTIYETDLKYALMKAIQELAAKVAKLEAA